MDGKNENVTEEKNSKENGAVYLYDALRTYCSQDHYPCHMPGHKRRLGTMEDPFTFDVTEIDGFDNLHHAEGILKEAQQRAASYYGASESHFLVNGSTCGILAAIGACAPSGQILMARNSHKAAYHAVFLNRLEVVYLYPEQENDWNGPIRAEAVREALRQHPKVRAVYLTSPTYDGVVSDVAAIAQAAHAHGIPLIVDEAHGAHFGMHPIFPESSVRLGADLVIHSVHKTLPSLTQTALLHVNGSLVDRRRLKWLLGVYQTSSPSYVLMASIDQCIRLLETNGRELFEELAENLRFFYEKIQELSVLQVIRTDDPSKILLSGKAAGLSGLEIGKWLRENCRIEVEMESVSYALALTSVGDTKEGFWRLLEALRELDQRLKERKVSVCEQQSEQWKDRNEACACGVCTIWEADQALAECRRLTESAGRVSGEFIYLYPPGVPLVVPGERIGENVLRYLLHCKEKGYELQGMEDYSMEYLRVLKE